MLAKIMCFTSAAYEAKWFQNNICADEGGV